MSKALHTRSFIAAGFLLVCGILTPQAKAGWVPFLISNGVVGAGNKSALVWEQVAAVGGAPVLYQFVVENVSAPGQLIDGVYFGVGNNAVAIAGGMQFANLAGGADGPFPAAAAPLPANPQPLWNVETGGQFLNVVGGFLVPGAVFGAAWGFQEYDDRAVGNLPATAYSIRWYQGVQGGAVAIPVGGYAYFSLTSNFGPVAGGGGVDPLGPGSDIGFDLETNLGAPEGDIEGTSPGITECTTGCDTSDFNTLAIAPEPGSLVLFAGGLIVLLIGVRLRRAHC